MASSTLKYAVNRKKPRLVQPIQNHFTYLIPSPVGAVPTSVTKDGNPYKETENGKPSSYPSHSATLAHTLSNMPHVEPTKPRDGSVVSSPR